jgi:hypothetical protein
MVEQYKAKQLPKLDQYIKEIEETTGSPLGDESKRKYYNLFTSPENAEEVDRMTQVMQRTVNLTASKKAADEELARIKADHAKLLDTVSKASQKMVGGGGGGNMRAAYAEAVAGNNSSAADVDAEVTASRNHDDSQRRGRDMFKSTRAPTAIESEWLADYGFSSDVTVAASANGRTMRPLPTSFPQAPEHDLLYVDGERQFEYSMRYFNPDLFGMAVSTANARPSLLAELTNVSINEIDDTSHNAYK